MGDHAIHSDFLIHWTGKDLDENHDPTWNTREGRTRTDAALTELYLTRLRDTLRHGLWLTEEKADTYQLEDGPVTFPAIAKTCFTELRLSESRSHAKRFGRLGIGVKRPFAFGRHGRPVAYVGFGGNAHSDIFLHECARSFADRSLLNFFKPMNSDAGTVLNYDYYGESEWRILYTKRLLEAGLVIDPHDPKNASAHAYWKALPAGAQASLKYLLPLDGWFAMIIYPTLEVKNAAQKIASYGIVEEIRRIKSLRDRANRVEDGNWPIEVNLDACRNF